MTFECYKLSAKQSYIFLMLELRSIYGEVEGVGQNYTKALDGIDCRKCFG